MRVFRHHQRRETMSDVNEAGLKALDVMCGDSPDMPMQLAAFGDRLKTIRDVLKGLVGSGAATAQSVWVWLPVALKLLVELGPQVQAIIDAIRDAIGKGKTPATFA